MSASLSVVGSERGATTLHIEHLAMSVAIEFIQLRNILDQHDTRHAWRTICFNKHFAVARERRVNSLPTF